MKLYFILLSVDHFSNPLCDALMREIRARYCKVEVTLSELQRYWHGTSTVMSNFYALKNASKINLCYRFLHSHQQQLIIIQMFRPPCNSPHQLYH